MHANATRPILLLPDQKVAGMNMYAPTPCADRNCHDLATSRGKCAAHQPKRWEGSTRKQRLPNDWNTRRMIVLRRDKAICHVCKGPNADAVDHVIPGDDHSLENLAAIHDRIEPHCHRTKSAKEGSDAAKGNRIKRRF